MNPWAKGTEAQPSSCQPSAYQPSAYQLFVIGCRDGRRTKKLPQTAIRLLTLRAFWRSQ